MKSLEKNAVSSGKKVKDNQTIFNKMNAGAMQAVDEGGEEDADANETNQQFEILCETTKSSAVSKS